MLSFNLRVVLHSRSSLMPMNFLGADSSLRFCLFVKRLNVVPLHMIISLNASVQYPSASLILSLCCYNFTLKKCHAKVSQISSEPDNIFAGCSWFLAGLQPLAKCFIFLRMKLPGCIVYMPRKWTREF